MDCLLATYAYSDEEDDQQQFQHQKPLQTQPIQSTFPSKPPSKFRENLFSLPPPKSHPANHPPQSRSDSAPSTSLFAKLPQPKSEPSDPFSLKPKPKRVVQFRPPVISRVVDDDDEEDGDEKEVKTKKDDYVPGAPSVKSFLSSIPAPRNSGSLGAVPSSAGVGRRSILEAEVPGLSNSIVVNETVRKSGDSQVKFDNSLVSTDSSDKFGNFSDANLPVEHDNSYNEYANGYANGYATVAPASVDYASNGYSSYSGYGDYQNVGTDHSSYGPAVAAVAPTVVDHSNYSGYEGYGGYENNGQYESKWIDRSTANLEPTIPMAEARPLGKRGRNEIPDNVIEVSQDELMKNRPREDQVKLTGIAFGPSYQPASSTKGKPSKLHKRKHQIGSLYFDMRSNESELAERRSKGMLTKAETHAKYGW